MEYPNGKVIQNVKAVARSEYFATAKAYAELFLNERLRYEAYASHKIVSVGIRWMRSHMWTPRLHSVDGQAMVSTDTYHIAVDVMAHLAWHYSWAQCLVVVEDGSPIVLTWHNGEWHAGDVLP